MNQALDNILHTPADIPVSMADVDTLGIDSPAFIYPLVEMLRHPHAALSDDAVSAAVTRIALAIPDTRRLRMLLDPEGTGRYDRFYPPQPAAATPSTDDAIDTFLATYGHSDPAEDELLNRMIFNPVPADYALTLDDTVSATAAPADGQSSLIDAFISTHPEAPAKPKAAPVAPPADDPPKAPAQGGGVCTTGTSAEL